MKKLISVLGVFLVTFILLEICLQILAFGAYKVRGSRANADVDAGEKVVLCLGDSYTYGVGASTSETSYPGRLQTLLNERTDGPWKVVNAGYPGNTSVQVLEGLDYHLRKLRPSHVITVVGVNDIWNKPGRYAAADLSVLDADPNAIDEAAPTGVSGSAFRLECRTLRLLKTFRGKEAFKDERIGQFNQYRTPSAFAADTGGPRQAFSIPLFLAQTTTIEGAVATNESENWEIWDASGELIADGKFDDAFKIYSRLSEDWEVERQYGYALVYGATGRRAEADKAIEKVKELAKNPDLPVRGAERVMTCLTHTGHYVGGVDTIGMLAERHPNNIAIYTGYVRFLINSDRNEEALKVSNHAWDLLEAVDGEHWNANQFYPFRMGLLLDNDPVGAGKCIVRAFLTTPKEKREPEVADHLLRATKGQVTEEHWLAALDGSNLQPTDRKLLDQVTQDFFHSTADPEADASATEQVMKQLTADLTANLETIHERASYIGAEVSFGTYPFLDPNLHEAQADAAEATTTRIVFLDSLMYEVVEGSGRPREDFFISDGHCNDLGYNHVAEFLYNAIFEGGTTGAQASQ